VSLLVRHSAFLLSVFGGLSCSAPSARPRGPAPVYERPQMAPWDAGARSTAEDPFSAVAESDWIGGNEDGGAADAAEHEAEDAPDSLSLDASGASTLH
jgi:hypothetical protein